MAPVKSSALIDTRVIYCGDNLDQLRKLPEGCVDLIYIDPPFNYRNATVVFTNGSMLENCVLQTSQFNEA
jgi:16S rRNA G966 N2-methylase RsmD